MALPPNDQQVLNALADAAELGLPCPTNAVLADALGYASDNTAGKVVARLAKAGYITVTSTRNLRTVVITATGASTRPPLSDTERRDILAQLVADGTPLSLAGASLNMNGKTYNQVWRGICADLGEQAR